MNFNFNPEHTFFTSDTHFNHASIIKFCNRPFKDVAMQMHITVGKQRIYLCHYPFLCFEGGYREVWQLFGHVHIRKNNTGLDAERLQYLYPTQYDVGVDNNNFTPVSYELVDRIIKKQLEKQ